MGEFEVAGKSYRYEKLSARAAWNVSRRYSPVLLWFAGLRGADAPKSPDDLSKGMLAMSQQVSQTDMDYVMNVCLGTVTRATETGTGWAPIQTPDGVLLFADIGLKELCLVMWKVVDGNGLVDFFSVPSASTSGQPPQA